MMLLAVLVGATCAQVDPAPVADPVGAEAYAAVGRTEAAAGERDTALVAYREAARLDPANAEARAGLERLCASAEAPVDPFEEGVRLLDSGEPRLALAEFEAARVLADSAGIDLMEGICHYELGEDDEARARLAVAEKDPETAQQARLFQGLVALRAGDEAEAASRFASAGGSADPRLSSLAGDLLKLSRREGRLLLGLALDPRFDTNVGLVPSGADEFEAESPDGAAAAGLSLSYRPFGVAGGPYLTLNGLYRKQFSLSTYDFGGVGGTAGWEWARRNFTGAAEYGFENYALGGAQYLRAHRALATLHWTPGALSLGASYRGRHETYEGASADYTGWRHAVVFDAAWRFEGGSSVALSWRVERDWPRLPELGFQETGPWAQAVWRATDDLRLGVQASIFGRDLLGAAAPPLPGERVKPPWDVVAQAALYAEHDLGGQFVLRGSLGTTHTASFSGFSAGEGPPARTEYTNLSASLGLAWFGGFF